MKEEEEDPCLEGWERASEKGGHPKEEKTTQATRKDQGQDSGQGGQPH